MTAIAPEEHGPAELERRSPGPLFFLSYSHTSVLTRQQPPERRRPTSRVSRFFEDLSENVAELVSRKAGADPGYMDTLIPVGRRWPAELLAALGSCQVFVALLSERYVTSEWCAREWCAFTQRRVLLRTDGTASKQTAIIPVIWAPVQEMSIPPVIAEVQRFHPRSVPEFDLKEYYEREGIFGLLKVDEDAYEAVVWRLAQRIAEIYYANYVVPRALEVDDLHDIFNSRQ